MKTAIYTAIAVILVFFIVSQKAISGEYVSIYDHSSATFSGRTIDRSPGRVDVLTYDYGTGNFTSYSGGEEGGVSYEYGVWPDSGMKIITGNPYGVGQD